MRARQERAISQGPEPVPGGDGPGGGGPASDELDEIRRAAEVHGFSLSRRRRGQRSRARAEDGRVRTGCSLPVPVRNAVEMARLEFNVPMSEILERAVVYYLMEHGLHVDGVTLPPSLDLDWDRPW
jgi:hypothetical protein